MRQLQRRPTVDSALLQHFRDEGKKRELAAESLQDGSWLLKVASENYDSCHRMCGGAQQLLPPHSLTWGSCCSGSEGARFCTEALNLLYRSKGGPEMSLVQKFSCESHTEKQKWIAAVDRHAAATVQKIAGAHSVQDLLDGQSEQIPDDAHSVQEVKDSPGNGDQGGPSDSDTSRSTSSSSSSDDDCGNAASAPGLESAAEVAEASLRKQTLQPSCQLEDVCIFRNIADLGNEVADCVTHNKPCAVPAVDLLIIGTSCKDMSRANNSAPKGPVLKMDASKGGSAQTFKGFMRYLESANPAIVIFENVDSMEDAKSGGESNLEVFQAEVSSRGYEFQVVMTDAMEFGLPARRRRLYVLLLRTNSNPLLDFQARPLAGMFATFGALLNGCLRTAPCASQLCLEADHPAVLHELQVRQEKRESERIRKEKEKEKAEKPRPKQAAKLVAGLRGSTSTWPSQLA